MRIGDLGSAGVRERLAGPGLALDFGFVKARVRSDVPGLARGDAARVRRVSRGRRRRLLRRDREPGEGPRTAPLRAAADRVLRGRHAAVRAVSGRHAPSAARVGAQLVHRAALEHASAAARRRGREERAGNRPAGVAGVGQEHAGRGPDSRAAIGCFRTSSAWSGRATGCCCRCSSRSRSRTRRST